MRKLNQQLCSTPILSQALSHTPVTPRFKDCHQFEITLSGIAHFTVARATEHDPVPK